VTPLQPALRWLARATVAVLGLWLAFEFALPDDRESFTKALLAAWQVPVAEALLWFALAWAILGLGLVIGVVRFRVLLGGVALEMGFAALFRAYLVATFFNLVLPGAMLGDVYRFFDARRATGEGAQVAGVVVLERLLSLGGLGAIALAVAPAVPLLQEHRQLLVLLIVAGTGFLALAGGLLVPGVNRWLQRSVRLLGRFSDRLVENLVGSLEALARISTKRSVVWRAFALSVVNQGLPVLALVALAVPLDALVPLYWFAVIVPFVTLVSLFPVSIGGAGVRELLYVALFGAVGMRAEAALALSLSVFAASILWGLLGLAVFALYPHPEPASPPGNARALGEEA
jgi:uncharacterized membrane protein YbhN (UPF0104 family)